MLHARSLGLILVVLLASCGGGAASSGSTGSPADSGEPPLTSDYDGIYAIASATLNDASCASEGPSVLADQRQKLFLVEKVSSQGDDTLEIASCTSAADCKAKALELQGRQVTGADWSYSFSGFGQDGSARTLYVTVPVQGMCADESVEDATITGDPRGALRLQVKITLVPSHVPDSDGTCSTNTLETTAASASCSQLKVIGGAYQESL